MHEHRGPAIAIAVAIVASMGVLAALVVIVGWVAFSVYAIVKATGNAPDEANPVVIALMFAVLVTTLVVLLCVLVGLIGRSMTPGRFRLRKKKEDEGFDLYDVQPGEVT
jgi:uncharacterized membrane protein